MTIIVQGPFLGKSAICEPILRSLPQWFGVEQSNIQYLKDIKVLPTFLAFVDDKTVGFLTLKQHNEYAAEIHVIGVHPEVHRKGIGRTLMLKAEKFLKQRGVEYLQVKTLGLSHPDKNYAKTRAFYLAMGFRPLEEFKDFWDDPCLLMVKRLGDSPNKKTL